jgi:hypothetical protein
LKNYLTAVLIFFSAQLFGQQATVKVKGNVYDPENKGSIANLMVVNKRTQQGYFGNNTGVFELDVLKEDTLIIAATGFSTIKISFRDSVKRDSYNISIPLRRLEVQLKEVEIFTHRDLEEIQKDIETLGYNEDEYMLTGIDAVSSPITALYQAFSRRERNKRMVAEMRNNDRRRSLLKELFRKYVDNDIIQLDNIEFDDFIDFCGVSDEYIKNASQYDFIMYIKKRFEVFRMVRNH